MRLKMSKHTVAVTDASFEAEVLRSEGPVLVDFWAEWCGPCKSIAPILDEISTEYLSRLKVVKLNTDENPDVSVKYAVRSIPTLMLFKNGNNEATRVGALTKAQLTAFIDEYL
jgi:thioredoxin 1